MKKLVERNFSRYLNEGLHKYHALVFMTADCMKISCPDCSEIFKDYEKITKIFNTNNPTKFDITAIPTIIVFKKTRTKFFKYDLKTNDMQFDALTDWIHRNLYIYVLSVRIITAVIDPSFRRQYISEALLLFLICIFFIFKEIISSLNS
ncbi:hypothetical protein MXB_3168 [Myxobolus squamalis]|nr:hypothetical protein MXB_3168 [Myxobolus squamalis]